MIRIDLLSCVANVGFCNVRVTEYLSTDARTQAHGHEFESVAAVSIQLRGYAHKFPYGASSSWIVTTVDVYSNKMTVL